MKHPRVSKMSERTKIDPLTSTRFIAAFLIVLAHSSGPAPFGYQFGLTTTFVLGSAGVSFFFVLSGFILTYTYGRLESANEVRNFWAARFARIWPTHALAFLLVIALLPANQWAIGGDALMPALSNLTLTHAGVPVPQYYFGFNAPSWSISTEAYFYLLYPLAALALARRPALVVGGAAVLALVMIVMTVILKLPSYAAETIAQPTSHGMISIHPATRFLEFACGMAAARLWAQHGRAMKVTGAAATAVETAAVLLAVASVVGFQFIADALDARGVPDAVTLWLRFSASAVPFAVLIFVLALEAGALARVLSWRPFVVLGEISFAMYMLHQIFLRAFGTYGLQAPEGLAWPAFTLFSVFIVALSYGVWVLVERPARRQLNQILQRKVLTA